MKALNEYRTFKREYLSLPLAEQARNTGKLYAQLLGLPHDLKEMELSWYIGYYHQTIRPFLREERGGLERKVE